MCQNRLKEISFLAAPVGGLRCRTQCLPREIVRAALIAESVTPAACARRVPDARFTPRNGTRSSNDCDTPIFFRSGREDGIILEPCPALTTSKKS